MASEQEEAALRLPPVSSPEKHPSDILLFQHHCYFPALKEFVLLFITSNDIYAKAQGSPESGLQINSTHKGLSKMGSFYADEYFRMLVVSAAVDHDHPRECTCRLCGE